MAWLWAACLGLVVGAGVGAMALSAIVLGGRGELEQRVQRWASGHGLRVAVGNVSASLTGRLRVSALRLDGGPGEGLAARFDAVDVRLDLMDLWRGHPRPRDVEVHGGRIALRLDEESLSAWRDAPDPESAPSDRATVSRMPDRVSFDGLQVELLASARGVTLPPLQMADAQGSVARQKEGGWRVEARGRLTLEGRPRMAELTVTLGENPSFTVSFDGPVEIGTTLDGKPLALRVSTLHRDARGVTRLEGIEATAGDLRASCGVFEALDGSGLIPDWRDVRQLRCDGASLGRGGWRAEASNIVVAGERAHGSLPEPRRIEVGELRVQGAGGRLDAAASGMRLELGRDAVEHALAGRWKDALVAVDLRGPSLRVELPGAGGLGSLAALDVPGADDDEEALEGEDAAPPDGEPTKSAGPTGKPDAAPPALLAALSELGPEPIRLPRGPALVELLRGVRLTLERGHIVVDTAERAAALRIDDLSLDVSASGDGGIGTHVAASMKRSEGRSGRFDLTADLDKDGAVLSAQGTVAGADFAHVLSSSSDYVTVAPEAWVQVDFRYAFEAVPTATHALRGEVRFEDFGFQAWRISHAPVSGIQGRFRYTAAWRPSRHHLELDVPELSLGDAHFSGSLAVTRPPGRRPRFGVRFTMPSQDCGAMARSIPAPLLPRLAGMRLSGRAEFDASLSVDLDKPYDLELRVDGDFDRCKVESLGDQIDFDALRSPTFVHHPVEPKRGRLEDIAVGPGTKEWVPSHLIPPFVKAAAVVTEDRNFWYHHGVRWELIARALKLDFDKGRFVYGGSTITQQLVKNLYLTREKTLSRKLEELFIVWAMERELDKDEILTLYLNVIEYGPDIYGVKRASRHYFAKDPWALSPAEAAFIMGLKPYPTAGYRQWQSGSLNDWWVGRVQHVLEMMQRRENAITEAEVLAAAPYQVRFRAADEPLWSDRVYVRPEVPSGGGRSGPRGATDDEDPAGALPPP
ncbi:MAG: transglycosylase domain-containing protein [Deltaproteobacteria bacterium]|nr:transglycosylase domain-containing protein [Deltaproteobacteria bacterium]MCB9785845.1 transglycosylase domain-containing protein [Deltaproteobacteria bacterium]